jgi:hypothetical protein
VRYIAVEWRHDDPDDPVTLYSELDEEQWEVRKVEVCRDGRCGFADSKIESGGTGLGQLPVPPFNEIVADPQFVLREISPEEFEEVWRKRLSTQ